MRILAIEKEIPGIADEEFKPHLKAEAAKVWELHQADVLRELYFRTDWPGAVLVLECADVEEANDVLNSLPLVKEGLIAFDVIPLAPYPGFARLFAEETVATLVAPQTGEATKVRHYESIVSSLTEQ